MSIVCFGHHHHFALPDFSQPTLQPNSFAKHNRAGWKWSRLATRPLPLGCGVMPAVCYSVALETLKRNSVSYLHLLQLFGWLSARRRLVETLSHKGGEKKEVIFYVCFNTICFSSSPLFSPFVPPFYRFAVRTNTMAELVFLETRRLWRILIKRSQDAASEHAHTRKTNTHSHDIRRYSSYSQPRYTKNTHAVPKTACKHTPALVYCHRTRGEAEGGGWRAWRQRVQYSWIWELENSLNSLQQEPHKDTTSAHKPLFALKIQYDGEKNRVSRDADLNISFNWLELE